MSNEAKVEVVPAANARIDLKQYRSLTSLPERAWKYVDDTMIRTAKEEMVGIADLNSHSGTSIFFDGLTASVYTKDRASEIDSATISMTPDTRGDSDTLAFDTLGVPLVVTYQDFPVNTKQVKSAAREGIPFQTTLVEEATRSVARKLEDTLFNGIVNAAGSTLYGYTKFPSRLTYTIQDWTSATTYPDEIFADVNAMVTKELENNHRGPWILYIPWEYQVRLNQDYTTGGSSTYPVNGTIYDRLKMIPGLEEIKVTQNLTVGNVVLVEMSSSTVQLINAMPMTVVDWEPAGSPNWTHNFKVMTMAIPFLQADYLGQCGIVHGSV